MQSPGYPLRTKMRERLETVNEPGVFLFSVSATATAAAHTSSASRRTGRVTAT